LFYFDWSGRQPPPPKSTSSSNGRLNVSPYIIAGNSTVQNDGDGDCLPLQRTRDITESQGDAYGNLRIASPSSRATHSRALPPYRPSGKVDYSSSSCVRSVELFDTPDINRLSYVATPVGPSKRECLSPYRSARCILQKEQRFMASALSSSSSSLSTRSLLTSGLKVNDTEIEMRQLDVSGSRSPSPHMQCYFDCETELTESNADRCAVDNSAVAKRKTGNVIDDSSQCLKTPSQSLDSQADPVVVTVTSFPPTNYPRMGKREPLQVALRKINSTVVISTQSGSTTGIAGVSPSNDSSRASVGGSMPCLQTMDNTSLTPPSRQQLPKANIALRNKIQPHQTQQQSRVRFSVDFLTTSTSGSCCTNLNDQRSLETSGSSLFEEEGYYTKDSSMSGFSTTGTCSSVNMTSSHRLLDGESAFF
jgi:hypothetical protein